MVLSSAARKTTATRLFVYCPQAYRRVSAHELERRPAVNVYVHPMYDSTKRVSDVSLIKVRGKVRANP